MFEKTPTTSTGPQSIVGANVNLTGVLKDANDITIYGSIEGEVTCQSNVNIEEKASVKGPISAKIVTVSGTVDGSILAETKLEITPSGKVSGSIATKDLIIKSGAQFNGKSIMLKFDAKIESPQKDIFIDEQAKTDKKSTLKTEKDNKKKEPSSNLPTNNQINYEVE